MHYSYKEMLEESILLRNLDTATTLALVEKEFTKQEIVEYNAMLENLKTLDEWCTQNNEAAFFTYFQDAVISAYCRYIHYKKKNWGAAPQWSKMNAKEKKKHVRDIVFSLIPAGTTFGFPAVTGFAERFLNAGENNVMHIIAAAAFGVIIAVPIEIVRQKGLDQEMLEKKHKYDETWVRHSLCDSRLRLALSQFVTSGQTRGDYEELRKSSFAILEQNLDQFAVNLCPNGMASRTKK